MTGVNDAINKAMAKLKGVGRSTNPHQQGL